MDNDDDFEGDDDFSGDDYADELDAREADDDWYDNQDIDF